MASSLLRLVRYFAFLKFSLSSEVVIQNVDTENTQDDYAIPCPRQCFVRLEPKRHTYSSMAP